MNPKLFHHFSIELDKNKTFFEYLGYSVVSVFMNLNKKSHVFLLGVKIKQKQTW